MAVKAPASSIATATYLGVPGGSDLAHPVHEIPDTHARYIQDAWLDQVGVTSRRGQVAGIVGVVTLDKPIQGLTETADPAGTVRIGAVNGDSGSGYFSVLADDRLTKTNLPWANNLGTAPYHIFDSKPALNAGVLVGVSSSYGSGATQALAHWRGANKPDYTTGTVTFTRGSTAIAGTGTSWAANVVPGMFLFATADAPAISTFIGVVKSVTDNTHVVLESLTPVAATAKAYKFTSLRGVVPKYYGYCTTDTANASVTGQNTSFIDNALNSGTWALYRQTDMAYIGQVSAVTKNDLLTLTANAAIALEAERFIALKLDGDYTLGLASNSRKVGFLNASWAEHQFYMNNGSTPGKGVRLHVTDPSDFEALNLSENDGDFFTVTSGRVGVLDTPGQAIIPTANALVVLKESEAFAVTGQAIENFALQKIGDDGAISGMSAQQYGGGCVWAGFNGVYFFDGTQVTNLVEENLGDAYRSMVRSFQAGTYRIYSMVVRDTYMLFFEHVDFPYTIRKGSSETTPSVITLAIYMPTQAVSFQTNLQFRGSISLPLDTGLGTWYAVNDGSGVGHICSTQDLFAVLGPDQIQCSNSPALGPDFYLESKRYNFGDALLKKLFKQIAMTYFVGGDNLKLDTIVGLNEDGTTSLTEWATSLISWTGMQATYPTWAALTAAQPTWNALASPLYTTKRIKFLKRSQHLGFRIWQKSANVSHVRLGPWSLGFKPQRAGRI